MDNKVKDIIENLRTISDACNTIELYYDCLDEAIEALEDNKSVVRCANCKNRNTKYCPVYLSKPYVDDDWFCADGEEW